MANPGLPVLVDQMRSLIAGAPVPMPEKARKAAVPTDTNGKPIVVTNPTGGQPAPTAQPAAQPAAQPEAASPATAPTSRTPAGAPPRNPSVAQTGGPAGARPGSASASTSTATPEELEAFARMSIGTALPGDDGLVEASATRAQESLSKQSMPGLKEDGTPEGCDVCGKPAVGYVLFAEGMAYQTFCDEHEQAVTDEAARATPDGEPDPSNIDDVVRYSLDREPKPHQTVSAGWSAPSGQVYSMTGSPGAVVVLVPKDDDPIKKLAGKDAHLTLAYLSQGIDLQPVEEPIVHAILDQVRQAGKSLTSNAAKDAGLEPGLRLAVDHVDTLGDALVAHVLPDPYGDLEFLQRDLTDETTPTGILDKERNLYRDKDFQPHVSLSYGADDPDDPMTASELLEMLRQVPKEVVFDRIGVWIGEDHYDFALDGDWEAAPTYSRHPAFGGLLELPEVTVTRGGIQFGAGFGAKS